VNRLFQFVDSWLAPGILLTTWVLMYATSNMHGIAVVVTLGAFIVVVALWAGYRELRVHAAASRHAAQGEPDELLALSEKEIGRRWTAKRRAPFHLYRAIALQQRGAWSEMRAALASPDLDRPGAWSKLRAALRVAALVEQGDVAAARSLLDRELADVRDSAVAREATARVLIAEGRAAEAAPMLEALSKDVRLGPAPRATAKALLARAQNAPVSTSPAPPSTGSGASDTPR
jgi:hypothetical protein